MFCSYCGKKINIKSSDKDTKYICPRCGKLVHQELNEKEMKDLSAACHTEIHKSNNMLNGAKASLMIGGILLAISFLFLLMSFKATAGGELVKDCLEFFTFIFLIFIGSFTLIYGSIRFVIGFKNKRIYQELLKNIQNETYIQ